MTDQEPKQAVFGDVRLLVGICGSVSALAAPHILYWLKSRLGVTEVRVILTAMARRFVTAESLRSVLGCEVIQDWDDLPSAENHVSVASWADVAVVLPATANMLGKLAHGIGDDVLSSVLLATDCPTVIVPATSSTTWTRPAVQRNVAQLRADGYAVIEPSDGISLAAGRTEVGSLGDFRRPLITALAAVLRHREDNGEGKVS
jgi:phosphopantothenoylcysteine decarboxylase/phosphopantothenate--cysteine ligase